MSWRLRLSVETILRLTPAVLGSTIGSSSQTLGSVSAVLLAFVVFVVWQQFNGRPRQSLFPKSHSCREQLLTAAKSSYSFHIGKLTTEETMERS